MKKRILYLSAIAAFSLSMTSCIDNEEPDGLKALREAKANELNANAAYTNAQAAQEQAKVAIINAEAAAKEIDNQIKQVELAKKQLELEVAKADNEALIAQAKADLAEAEGRLAVAKTTAEKNLATAQAALAAQKAALAKAEADAATVIAKATADAIKANDAQLTAAMTSLTSANKTLIEKANALQEAQEALVVALGTASRDSISNVQIYKNAISAAERAVKSAEYNVSSQENALAKAKEAAKNDDEATWVALYNEEVAIIEKLTQQISALSEKKTEANNAVTAANQAYTDKRNEIYDPLNKYNDEKKVYTYTVKNEDLIKSLTYYSSWVNPDGYIRFEFKNTAIQSVAAIANEDFAFDAEYLLSYLEGKVATESQIAYYTQVIKELQSQMTATKAAYEADLADFKKAVEPYQKAAVDYQWSDDNSKSTLYDEIYSLIYDYYYTSLPEDKASAVAAKLENFLKLRKVFDGFENTSLSTIVTGYTSAKYSDLKDYLYNNNPTTSIGNSSRYYGGAYYAYYMASNSLQGGTAYVVMYDDEKLDEMYENSPYNLRNYYGSLGRYAYAVRYIADKSSVIENQADWKALFAAVEADKDAIEAAQKKLTADIEAGYAKELNPLLKAIEAAQDVVEDLDDQIAALNAEKTAAMSVKNVAYNNSSYSTVPSDADHALYVEQSINALENNVATAKETLQAKKNALEVAKATLVAYQNGTLTNETVISNAKVAVEKAQADYNDAKVKFELAEAEYNAIKKALTE